MARPSFAVVGHFAPAVTGEGMTSPHALSALAALGQPSRLEIFRLLMRNAPAGLPAGEIAQAIGAPAAVRAVGAANGANPVALVVPCHRIIGSNGQLTGYGGGLDRKRWLLSHESRARLF